MILCQGRVEPGQVMLPGKGVFRAVGKYGTPIWTFPVLKFVGWADLTPRSPPSHHDRERQKLLDAPHMIGEFGGHSGCAGLVAAGRLPPAAGVRGFQLRS